MSNEYLVIAVIIRVVFVVVVVTLRHRIADPVTGCSPTIRADIRPQPSIFRQLYTALATEWHWLAVSYWLAKMGFRVVAIIIADCSLGGPVLNLLRIGENQNIVFLLVREASV